MLTCKIWIKKSFDDIEYRYHKLKDYHDIEVLHQYRVALRKLFAINKLFLVNNVLHDQDAIKFKKLLKRLIKPTNVLRDYDIFLMELQESPFPKELTKKLKKTVSSDRVLVLKETLYEVGSEGYKKDLHELISHKKSDEFFLYEFCKLRSSEIITTIKWFEHMALNSLEKMSEKSDPSEFHDLRKEFKVIRYILAAYYGSHYDKVGSSENLTKLKKIQDILGVVQDSNMILQYMQHLLLDYEESEQQVIKRYYEKKYLKSVHEMLEIKNSAKEIILTI